MGCCCCKCVNTGEIGIVESFGRFNRVARAGLTIIAWPMEDVVGLQSLRVQQLDVLTESKTKDDVTVHVKVAVQYQVIPDKVYDAYYKLTRPELQIRAYVDDVVRSTMPRMSLDTAFEAKEDVARSVKESLDKVMHEYGYQIMQALVTDLQPDAKVRNAMNEINAAKRQKQAAAEKAEGDKILLVKAAEAEAESKYLSGVGVARQRKAIIDGFKDSVLDFQGGVEGTTSKDIINMMMVTQYLDMLKDVGQCPTNSTTFVPHSIGGGNTGAQVRDGLMQAASAQ
jgi:regulator of protease activity HflC (stomatin/prohibitin superfamily)